MSAVGQSNPFTDASEYNTLAFIIARALDEVQTVSIAEVKAVDTGAQTVDILVLVNLITGANITVPHGMISSRPYVRAQGGSSGIILDPVVGDIGVVVFGSRDLTAVISTKGPANPGSQRRFSWSDGIYFGGILNAAPTQYIQFLPSDGGINIHSAGTVTIDAPTVHATGDAQIDGDVVVTGDLHAGTLHAGDGFTGTFATGDSRTVTVVDGIITGVA